MTGPRVLASKRTSMRFSVHHSTASFYEISVEEEFVGPFAHIRSTMDLQITITQKKTVAAGLNY